MGYEKKPKISDQTIQKKTIKERALTVWLKRAESPKDRSSGQHPGYTRSQQCALQGQKLKNVLFFKVFSHFPCTIQIIIVNLQ